MSVKTFPNRESRVPGNIVFNTDGSVVNTLQPAFLVYKNANKLNITGAGTVAALTWQTEQFDQGGDFASDTFTAPVTGKYPLSAQVRLSQLTALATSSTIRLIMSNNTIIRVWTGAAGTLVTDPSLVISGTFDMDANDTATVSVSVTGEAADTVDVLFGSAGNPQTFFSGHLAC